MQGSRAAAGLAVVGALLVGEGCGGSDRQNASPGVRGTVDGLPLVSDRWTIREMATAHGAFTVEVEVALGVDTTALTHELVEPLQATYAEVLVYFYDRAAGDDALPILRVQWTASDGYLETRS